MALASRGAHVLVVGRDEQRAKDVVAEIEGSGGSATFRLTSLVDLESVRDLVEWATLGDRRHRRHNSGRLGDEHCDRDRRASRDTSGVGLSTDGQQWVINAYLVVGDRMIFRLLGPIEAPASASASANLRQYVAQVRRMLRGYSLDGAARLCSTATGYRLEVGREEFDLTIAADLIQTGREALAAHDPGTARACMDRAVTLWRGELCEDLSHYPELEIERAYWAEMRLQAAISLRAARLELRESLIDY